MKSQQRNDGFNGDADQIFQRRLQLIDTLKVPIIEMGRNLGYEVIENYDLGGGPIHVCWVFKPGSESLPDLRLGFICTPEENESDLSEFSLNESIARAMINLIDKLILVVPSETMTKRINDSIKSMPDRSIMQLRKYVTVLTTSTLVSRSEITGSREAGSQRAGEII